MSGKDTFVPYYFISIFCIFVLSLHIYIVKWRNLVQTSQNSHPNSAGRTLTYMCCVSVISFNNLGAIKSKKFGLVNIIGNRYPTFRGIYTVFSKHKYFNISKIWKKNDMLYEHFKEQFSWKKKLHYDKNA